MSAWSRITAFVDWEAQVWSKPVFSLLICLLPAGVYAVATGENPKNMPVVVHIPMMIVIVAWLGFVFWRNLVATRRNLQSFRQNGAAERDKGRADA